jgi:hypothetical protein
MSGGGVRLHPSRANRLPSDHAILRLSLPLLWALATRTAMVHGMLGSTVKVVGGKSKERNQEASDLLLVIQA